MAIYACIRALSIAVVIGWSQAAIRPLDVRQSIGECSSAASGNMFLEGRITGPLPSPMAQQAEETIVSADLIDIKYGSNFKVLLEKYSKEMYVLTQCGTTPPSQAQIDAVMPVPSGFTVKNFTVPLQSVGSAPTVNLPFFKALSITARAHYVSEYAVDACWQKALACGAKADMAVHLPQVDAWFMDCHWQRGCINVNEQAKAVHVSATQDPGPLRSAEHIKFVAAFFNKEQLASQLFADQVTAYTRLAASYQSLAVQPVVAWIEYSAYGKAFTLSQALYKLEYVRHAGGSNVDGDAAMQLIGSKMTKTAAASGATYTLAEGDFNGTAAEQKAKASEAFFNALRSLNVSVVVDETYAFRPSDYTISTFYAHYGLSASSDLRFVVEQMVLRVDGIISESDGLAWFESRIAHPELAAEGLARHLHADSSKQKTFFRNIAKAERPAVISKDSCSAVLPACDAAAYAEKIGMMTGSEISASSEHSVILSLLLLCFLAALP